MPLKDTFYADFFPFWQDMTSSIAKARKQNERLSLPQRVSFIGRFKTGKSRLINALVGADILPNDLDECTAHLVELAHDYQPRSTRLIGYDLDTATQEPITIDQFKFAVDLTKMGGQIAVNKDIAFRFHLPAPLLKSITIIDTPGFDGTNNEMREHGKLARERAIRCSDCCVLVLSTGLSEDDLSCARMIQQHGSEMVVVLNQSDKYDSDERQEIQEQILFDLEREIGVTPSFYSCSALWQSGSEKDRDELKSQRRFFDDEEEVHWHQWSALLDCLSNPTECTRHIAFLETIHHTFKIVMKADHEYNIVKQAEAAFLDYLPRWKIMMPSIVGQTVLELAVSAAKSNRPLPWKRLENYGIFPKDMAPESVLPHGDLKQLYDLYLKTLTEVVRMAVDNYSATLYNFVLLQVSQFAKWLDENMKMFSASLPSLQSLIEDISWYSQPLKTDFTYSAAFLELQMRWKKGQDVSWNLNNPVMDSDCARIRKRLTAALV